MSALYILLRGSCLMRSSVACIVFKQSSRCLGHSGSACIVIPQSSLRCSPATHAGTAEQFRSLHMPQVKCGLCWPPPSHCTVQAAHTAITAWTVPGAAIPLHSSLCTCYAVACVAKWAKTHNSGAAKLPSHCSVLSSCGRWRSECSCLLCVGKVAADCCNFAAAVGSTVTSSA